MLRGKKCKHRLHDCLSIAVYGAIDATNIRFGSEGCSIFFVPEPGAFRFEPVLDRVQFVVGSLISIRSPTTISERDP